MSDLLATVPDILGFFDDVGDPVLLAGLLCLVSACVAGFGLPALTIPLAFSSGVLFDGMAGALAVLMGLVLGSQAMFLAARKGAFKQAEGSRIATCAAMMQQRAGRLGPFYSAGLRVVGTPHAIVAIGSALAGLRHRDFAMATAIGCAPAVGLGAAAGAAF